MTRRRRTANPIFQRPLTTAELTKQVAAPKTRYVRCFRCGTTGTQHGGLHKVEDGWYECNNAVKCEKFAAIWASKKERKDDN